MRRLVVPVLLIASCALGAWESRAQTTGTPPRAAAPVPGLSPLGLRNAEPLKPLAPQIPPVDPARPRMERLTHADSGPGVVVLDPVLAPNTAPEAANFATGCARWLQLQLGGQGEFGKSPEWYAPDTLRLQRHWPDLRLRDDKATVLAKELDLTHVVLAEVSGKPDQVVLTLRLLSAPAMKPVGAPVVLTGSKSEVVKQLPQSATGLSTRLGLAKPSLTVLSETPEDLAFLGNFFRSPGLEVSRLQVMHLETLARTSVLAAVMAVERLTNVNDNPSPQHDYRATVLTHTLDLLRLAKGNTLVLEESAAGATVPHIMLKEEPRTRAARAPLDRYPNNYLLNLAAHHFADTWNDADEALTAAERCVRCTPGSGYAWGVLGDSLFVKAGYLRRGRFSGELRPEESAQLGPLYADELNARRKAVQLMPEFARGWKALSLAASWLGGAKEAEQAFEKSIALENADPDFYDWGMELFGPKWFSNPAKLKRVFERTALAPYRTSRERVAAAFHLWQHQAPAALIRKTLKTDAELAAYRECVKQKTIVADMGDPGSAFLQQQSAPPTRRFRARVLFSASVANNCLAWSPDGTTLAAGSPERLIQLWKPNAGKGELRTIPAVDSIRALVWSPDGKRIAAAGEEGTVRIWDAQTLREMQSLKGHMQPVSSVDWNPRGDLLATGGDDKTVRVWDVESGKTLHTLRPSDAAVRRVSFSPDGARLLTATEWEPHGVDVIRIWDVKSGTQSRGIGTLRSMLTTACWSPDGRHIAAGDQSKTVSVWNAATGEREHLFTGTPMAPGSVAWSGDGQYVLAGYGDHAIYAWDTTTGLLRHKLEGHAGGVRSLAWSQHLGMLASAATDRSVLLWDIKAGGGLGAGPLPVQPGGLTPVIAGNAVGRQIMLVEQSGTPLVLALSPDGKTLLCSTLKLAALFDAETGRRVAVLAAMDMRGPVVASSAAFSPNGKNVVLSLRGELRSFNTETGAPDWSAPSGGGDVLDLQFTADGRQLIGIGQGAHRLLQWDAATGKSLHSAVVDGQPMTIAVGKDNDHVIYGTGLIYRMGIACYWNPEKEAQGQVLDGHSDLVSSLAFSPDLKRVASGSFDRTVKVWDSGTGKLVSTLTSLPAAVVRVRFLPDGRLAIASDGAISLWNVATGQKVSTLDAGGKTRGLFSLSADGKVAVDALVAASPAAPTVIRRWEFH